MPADDSWRRRPPFRLGEVEVRPASNELVVEGQSVRIKPRPMDVLLRLAAAAGEVVSRETLLTDAWPRRMVNDEVLSRVIADLRAALRDDAREARYIETLPKVGYRLVAPMAEVAPSVTAEAGVAPSPADAAPARAPRRRWPLVAGLAAVALGAAVALLRSPPPASVREALTAQIAAAQPFSSEVDLEVLPRFSPDGRQVAFVVGLGRRAQVVVREVGGGGRTVLGERDGFTSAPVFFPDGKRIAVFRALPGDDCEIASLDIATGASTRLVDCARSPGMRFDLSPDGRTLVYVGSVRPQYPAGLVARDLATGDERVLTAPDPDDGNDVLPRFSPDGARIAFFRGTQSHRELWLVDAGNPASARAAGSPRGLAYGAAWLGKDGPLLVAADWFGQRSLNVLDPRTGKAAAVGARGARSPDVDRDGDIVYENAVYSANLFLVDPRDESLAPREMWPSTRYTNQAEYAPDGASVAFVSNRDGPAALYVASPRGDARRIALDEDYVYMRPHWSRDGRHVYAVRASRREDGTRVQQGVRIAAGSGEAQVLATFGDNVFDVREDGDGRLVVGELVGNAARILRADRPDATPERLPLPMAGEYQVAGKRIAIMQPNLAGLTLCDAKTLACEPLALPIDEGNRFDWLLTKDAVWYRTAANPGDVVRYDLARREVTWRRAFGPTAVGVSIAVSPDESALLVAREAPLAVDLMYAPRVARK